MKLTALIVIAAVLIGFSWLALALWRHKKASASEVKLIGELGQVETKLEPEGTIIVCGELWRAKSSDGAFIEPQTRVRAVGIQGHLVLVEIPH